ncbi:MAG: hypothetical protein HC886_21180 [Leptolyngbyaceae cyanobacterium SM1_1_3]|nr:hypothetical protein [Leptolyngbyaceae cyanobacterium SM1_1_3]NJN01250.1 hypothetical protein [Leptolyngbyaceae cyanobacterium RM1_1_2]NJO11524.1 hypothetical protein [Leptolyngbyaceae cyanobacterium SL_1_1]
MTPKSSVLLAGACLAAISAVAAIFELSSGEPDWGATPTILLLAVCVPLVGIFFYAAVKDARANQE